MPSRRWTLLTLRRSIPRGISSAALGYLLVASCGRTSPWDLVHSTDAGNPDGGSQRTLSCADIAADSSLGTDQQVWDCAVVAGTFGRCVIGDALNCSECACTAYVKVTGGCAPAAACAGWHETGCSDSSFFSGAPMFCSGPRVEQSACMIRQMLKAGVCRL